MQLLEARDVGKVYETRGVSTRALSNVNLRLDDGEFAALAGPSGSGKTTLLNLFGGLDAPTEGSVLLGGKDLGELSPAELARERLHKLGFVFQAYNLIPVLTARENVEFVMELQGVTSAERRERALAMLEEVGLGGLGDKRPLEMSGGQQQRVAVARAIVGGPRLVLADEPTGELDETTGNQIAGLLDRVNADGTSLVVVTHDPLLAGRAHRHLGMRSGRLLRGTGP